MKHIFIMIIGLLLWSDLKSQDYHKFEFSIDSILINGKSYACSDIKGSLKVGKPKYFVLFEQDSIAIRIRAKLTKRFSQPKILKIRIDFYEDGVWHKAPIYIDTHGFARFRIRREQCWQRTTIGYNAGFPIKMFCTCDLTSKRKQPYNYRLRAKVIVR